MSIVYYLNDGPIKGPNPKSELFNTLTNPQTDTITKREMIPHSINFLDFAIASGFVPSTKESLKIPYKKQTSEAAIIKPEIEFNIFTNQMAIPETESVGFPIETPLPPLTIPAS